jgi:hypothetical protein
VDLCQKKRVLGLFGLWWEEEEKIGNGVIEGPAEGGGGAELPRWCGGGGGSEGWRWVLDFREFDSREMREKGGELYGGGGK